MHRGWCGESGSSRKCSSALCSSLKIKVMPSVIRLWCRRLENKIHKEWRLSSGKKKERKKERMHFSASCPRLHLLLPAALREQREHWHLVSCLVSRSCCRQEAVDSWTSAVYYLLIRGVFNISDQVSPHWWRRQSDRKFLLYILYSTGQINIIRLFSFLFLKKKKNLFNSHQC